MGVLKNDVGRPSNKTIRTRLILKFIAIIAFISIGFLMGLQISDLNQKETGKEIAKTDKITLEEIIKKYNTGEFDDKYSLIDMNDDKIDELIYYDQTGDINFNLYIYNGAKNGYSLAKEYKKLNLNNSNVMKTKEEDCLLVYSAHMGTESIDRLYFNDGKIKVTKYEHELSGEEQYLTDSYKDTLVWKYASELNKKEVNVNDAEKMITDIFGVNYINLPYFPFKGFDADILKAVSAMSMAEYSQKNYNVSKYFDMKYDKSYGEYMYQEEMEDFTYTAYYLGRFIEYDEANKAYKKLFGNSNVLPKENILTIPTAYIYSKELNVYAESAIIWGDGGYTPIGGVIDAYESNDKIYVTVAYGNAEYTMDDNGVNKHILSLTDGSQVELTNAEIEKNDIYTKYKDKLKQEQYIFFKEDGVYKFEGVKNN